MNLPFALMFVDCTTAEKRSFSMTMVYTVFSKLEQCLTRKNTKDTVSDEFFESASVEVYPLKALVE